MTLGTYLKQARLNKSLTQLQVANKLGVTINFVSLMERDEVPVPLIRLKGLIQILGLNKNNIVKIAVDKFQEDLIKGLG